MHKQIALILAIGYTLSLTLLSLISLNGLPELGSSFDDKIYHLIAYMLMTLLWFNVLRTTSAKFKILYSAIISIGYGIIIEVFQALFTTSRNEDIEDVIANSIGVILGVVIIIMYRKIKLK